MGIISTIQVLDFFMLGDRAVADFSRTGRLNTDDHPRLEFLAPRSLRRKQSWVENFAALRLAREPIDAYLVGADPDWRARLGALVCRHDLEARRPVSRARGPRRRGAEGLRRGRPPQPRRHPRADPARPVSSRTGPSMTNRPVNRESVNPMARVRKRSPSTRSRSTVTAFAGREPDGNWVTQVISGVSLNQHAEYFRKLALTGFAC